MSRVIAAIMVAAILATSSLVYSAAAQVIIYDDFDDNQIDSSRWTKVEDGSIPPVLDETNQRLEIFFPTDSAGSTFLAGYRGVCELNGDFDIQVDYDLLVWPSTSGVRLGLGVDDGSSFWVVERISLGTSSDFPAQSNREVYATDFNSNVEFTPTGDNSGILRLVRSGNSLTAYAGSNTLASSTITSSTDLQFAIASWSHDYAFTDKEVRIAFDNFVVNEGGFANCDLTPTNSAPTANAGADQTVNEGDTVTLDGSASSDVDGTIASYSWTQTAGTSSVTLSDASSARPTFTAPDVGPEGDTLTFELTVTDNDGATSTTSDTVNVIVQNIPDTTPPVVTVPDDITEEATSRDGAEITYEATAEDDVDGPVDVTCNPESGSTFPIGETIVECSATDAAGNTGTGSFTVTIQDTTPPAISVPDDITAEATSPDGAVVSFDVSAEDLVDGPVDVSCDHNSGETFPIGETVVTCNAEDSRGNSAEESSTITVQDTTAPDVEITGAEDRSGREITDGSGRTPIPYIRITFEATDAVGIDSIECSLDGGAFTSCTSPVVYDRLSRGSHEVTVRATDAAGNTGEDEFTWTVGAPPSAPRPAAPQEQPSSAADGEVEEEQPSAAEEEEAEAAEEEDEGAASPPANEGGE